VARLDPIKMEDLTPQQKVLHDELLRTRKRVSGPFGVWLRNPPLADAANKLVLAVREHGKLEKRLYELIVLTVVRYWSASYAWAAHEGNARTSGLEPEVIEAIRARRKPTFSRPEESMIYDAVTSLMDDKKLSEPAYQGLIKQFGLDRTIEIVTIAGLYSMVATVLNGFEIPTPNGERPFG
jgi:4-carboxymuconolactone decarboxylase